MNKFKIQLSGCAAAILASAVTLCVPATRALAQDVGRPLDVMCSTPVVDAGGAILPGSNPSAPNFGMAYVEGSLVQIIRVGDNGVPDLPDADGSVGGDDILFDETVIGQGIAPNLVKSGRFSTSFHPPPPSYQRVYARVFDAPTLSNATHWGQSAAFQIQKGAVMDIAELGLWVTGIPIGVDLKNSDTDGDGATDFEELLANTNADDGDDFLSAQVFTAVGQVEFDGRAGRAYNLLRTTNDLNDATVEWESVASTALLTSPQSIILSDPNPPSEVRVFYRVEATIP
ncbi:MAG: hypothetical protein KJ626_09960 [Verrucomicrobia bacterium]|nr:hypothetical protein [Verrucomicrobiota bacterium]